SPGSPWSAGQRHGPAAVVREAVPGGPASHPAAAGTAAVGAGPPGQRAGPGLGIADSSAMTSAAAFAPDAEVNSGTPIPPPSSFARTAWPPGTKRRYPGGHRARSAAPPRPRAGPVYTM